MPVGQLEDQFRFDVLSSGEHSVTRDRGVGQVAGRLAARSPGCAAPSPDHDVRRAPGAPRPVASTGGTWLDAFMMKRTGVPPRAGARRQRSAAIPPPTWPRSRSRAGNPQLERLPPSASPSEWMLR